MYMEMKDFEEYILDDGRADTPPPSYNPQVCTIINFMNKLLFYKWLMV